MSFGIEFFTKRIDLLQPVLFQNLHKHTHRQRRALANTFQRRVIGAGCNLASSIALAAEIAEKNGKSPSDVKIAMAFENDPFSQDVRAGVMEDAAKYDMQIVIDDKLPRDLSDMSATLTKVRAVKPDVLLVSGHSKGAATAARQIKEMQIDVPMVAITHCEAADVIGKS